VEVYFCMYVGNCETLLLLVKKKPYDRSLSGFRFVFGSL